MNVVLTGMMGSGKTTVSRLLSEKLGLKAYDSDAEITARYGRIADIFANSGEERFREIETETLRALSDCEGVIISTGGGCVLKDENVRLLKRNGVIFYLRARAETLFSRIGDDPERPLLTGGAKEKIAALVREREPFYGRAADFTVDTDLLTAEEVANKITELLR